MILAFSSSSEWADAMAFSVIAICLLLVFAVYRFTGGKWPD